MARQGCLPVGRYTGAVVLGIGMWQVYLNEEVLPLPLSPRLYSEAESIQIDSEKQSALSKGTRKGD
jgi:hypothetical protein